MSVNAGPIDVSGKVTIFYDLAGFVLRVEGVGKRLSNEGVAVFFSHASATEPGRANWLELISEGQACKVYLDLAECPDQDLFLTTVAAYREYEAGWDVVFSFDSLIPSIFRADKDSIRDLSGDHEPTKRRGYETSDSFSDWSRRFDEPGLERSGRGV